MCVSFYNHLSHQDHYQVIQWFVFCNSVYVLLLQEIAEFLFFSIFFNQPATKTLMYLLSTWQRALEAFFKQICCTKFKRFHFVLHPNSYFIDHRIKGVIKSYWLHLKPPPALILKKNYGTNPNSRTINEKRPVHMQNSFWHNHKRWITFKNGTLFKYLNNTRSIRNTRSIFKYFSVKEHCLLWLVV